MAERGTNQGYVFFNKQRKRWNAQYMEYDVQTGISKPKTKSFKTQEEAKKYLTSIMYQKENPVYIENNGIPLCEFMKLNLKIKFETEQIKAAQYGRSMKTIEQIERLPIGQKNIDKITTEELQNAINYYNYLSKSSINKIYQLYYRTFKNALDRGYLTRNPMINVIKPKSLKSTKKVRALTLDEQKAFTKWLLSKNVYNCKYKNVYLIQMYMGPRVGEVLALTRDDIDLNRRTMKIERTLTTDEYGNVIMGKTTKTERGKRTLPIPDYIFPCIVEQLNFSKEQENNEEKLLFKPNNQKYTKRENVNSELKRILKKEFGIEDISTHSLRHTFCTRWIEGNGDPTVVAAILGQSGIEMALGVYTDVQDRFKIGEMERVNNYYKNENLITHNNSFNSIDIEDR